MSTPNSQIQDSRLPMSNGQKPDIGSIVAIYPLRGGWQLWVGIVAEEMIADKLQITYGFDLWRPHPNDPTKRGWFTVAMTTNLPLKLGKKLNPQPWVAEEARADGTIGTICPVVLIRHLKIGSVERYVAVERNERHATGLTTEVSRKSWTNPKNIIMPKDAKPVFHDVGFTNKNNARISGVTGESIKLQVAVVHMNEGGRWPKLEGATWMTFRKYADTHDGAGKDALFNAREMGYLD